VSVYENSHDDIPRFEPWLGVMASSAGPALIALYLPRYFVPLIVAAVALFLASLVMLRRQTVRRRLRQPRMLPAPLSVARSFDGGVREVEGAEP
jgi:uncharacterized membrane protein YfcA